MRATFGEKTFYAVNYLVLTCAALLCLFPLIHIAALSFSNASSVLSGNVSVWPKGFNLQSYRNLFEGTRIVQAFLNSVLITAVGTGLSMLFTILAAYPLSRVYFYGRRSISMAVIFTMLFTGGMIPTYLVVKSLGLLNNYGSLWFPGLVSVYNMLVMKNFFEGIPQEMEEAARIDGCSELGLLIRIMLPLSLPVMAALTLFYGVGYWNSFMSVLIYITDADKLNLAVMVQQMVQNQSMVQEMNQLRPEDIQMMTPESMQSAAIIVMIVPMLAAYPFVQRYFVQGVMIGAVKG
ncbi:ABC transporter permease [Paenibacillus rhizosphaerae]|uniref:ABC transporter permease n=1 Tax=Paenibacillus rhizosphaerae TaxID=297318 RepID=A0A1R1EC68_9BACL|nr:carbohydrate ABC transporter permease [Paenibacillus rhizosphaerae]OMF49423.1 ABC transporter permease [Paenibacillus rhizosphaerae]